jgi:predicted PurR-regulated permease PerM
LITAADAWQVAWRTVLLVAAIVLLAWLALTLQDHLLKLLLAIILATGLRPLVAWLEARGVRRGPAVLIIYFGFVLVAIGLLVVVVPPIVHQTELVVMQAPSFADQIVIWAQDARTQLPFMPEVDAQVRTQLRALSGQIGALASQAVVLARFALGVFSGLLSTVLILLITLYLIVDGGRIRDYLLTFVASGRHAQFRRVTDRIGTRMGGWLLGQVTLSLLIGTISFIGLTVLGIPGAVLLAVLAGIGEAIPLIGPIASAIPAIIVGFSQSTWQGVAVLVLYIVIQQLENNLIVPKVMGRAVALHPLPIVLALLFGGELLGLLGTIVAVPVAAAIAVLLDEVRRTDDGERVPRPD